MHQTVKFVFAFHKLFETLQQVLRHRPVHGLVVFGSAEDCGLCAFTRDLHVNVKETKPQQ